LRDERKIEISLSEVENENEESNHTDEATRRGEASQSAHTPLESSLFDTAARKRLRIGEDGCCIFCLSLFSFIASAPHVKPYLEEAWQEGFTTNPTALKKNTDLDMPGCNASLAIHV
jgi:hypothetical protein